MQKEREKTEFDPGKPQAGPTQSQPGLPRWFGQRKYQPEPTLRRGKEKRWGKFL